MMFNIQILDALVSFTGVAALLGFFYGPWQRIVVDIVRQQLFEIRDKAFDKASSGELDFDSRQYIAFRDVMNSMIRNAHSSTIWRHVAYAVMCRDSAKYASATMIDYISAGDDTHILKRKFNQACGWIMLMLWLRSPFIMLITMLLSATLPLVALLAAVSARVRRTPKRLEVAIKHQIQRDAALNMGQESDCVIA